jgi:hypothetical protein
MARKRVEPKMSAPVKKGGAKKHNKQTTQKTPMQRIAVMGPTGKVRFEWREW